MTIRSLVKKELTKSGYPIEVSHWSKSRAHVRNLYHKRVAKEGIELDRTLNDKFKRCMNRDDKIETLIICTNGFISKEEMQKIVDKCKENYHPYKTDVNVYIY